MTPDRLKEIARAIVAEMTEVPNYDDQGPSVYTIVTEGLVLAVEQERKRAAEIARAYANSESGCSEGCGDRIAAAIERGET